MPAIDVAGLNFTYPDGLQALTDIHFTIDDGESVALVGPNGAGKTTLFLCLSGVLRGKASSIKVGPLDPRDAAQRRQLPHQVGIVFQNSDDQIFNPTVFDDVAFGPMNFDLSAGEVHERVTEALKRVGLSGFEERVPFHLSGGEKRRVALAGVLAMRPRILLLDEPSMHLDPRGRRQLIGLVNELAVTKLIASHDLEMILDTCPRTIVLDRGRVVADGRSEILLADADLMEAHGLEVPYRLRK